MLDLVEAVRPELEGVARRFARSGHDVQVHAQAAQVADWMHRAFVRRNTPMLRISGRRYQPRSRSDSPLSPFRAEAERQGRIAYAVCESIHRRPCPSDIARRLRLPPDRMDVIQRENRYFVDGRTWIGRCRHRIRGEVRL